MNKLIIAFITGVLISGCNPNNANQSSEMNDAGKKEFNYMADRFADIQVLRYEIPGWEGLSVKEKQLAYYLYQAGLSGRDIFYDQKYKHGLRIRKTLETILETYKGDKNTADYKKFEEYCKRFFFANGNHHHYSADKFIPECPDVYFAELIKNSDQSRIPLEGKSVDAFWNMMKPIIFDPNVDKKEVDLSDGIDNIKASSNNYYEGVTEQEVDQFYADMKKAHPEDKSQLGLNSKLVKENGKIVEKRWMVGGMYSPAIEKIVYWLEKAVSVAENDKQKQTFEKLIKYYKSGDPKDYDEYCMSWVKDTASRFDLTNGFVEVYQDALQKRGAYESITAMKDMEATKRIAAISNQAQWFEDNSPIMNEHKKKDVKGISAKVITVINEVGDAAPATPIGINLPNNEWIRESPEYGSKSVSLGNIVAAYNYAKSKSPVIGEFGASDEVKSRVKQYGALAADLHTDMHECIGHASGQRNKGVGTSDETLKNYAGTLEEARADLVALYYAIDQKLVDIGVMPSIDCGKAEYDNYLMNGLMTQLNRIKLGDNLEEAHMRNRQLNSAWVLEKGKQDKSIELAKRNGKTYVVVNDYNKVRQHFGELLREIQRIKSEGDFEAGKKLVENYGVKIDPALHKEVLERYATLNVAPYLGFIQPKLIPVMNGENITDVKVEYPESFLGQHLEYGKEYGFLPVTN
jgi:dipeptidyl-peptidase III